jgi:hypothetical protein
MACAHFSIIQNHLAIRKATEAEKADLAERSHSWHIISIAAPVSAVSWSLSVTRTTGRRSCA